jgi:hypothetical protein
MFWPCQESNPDYTSTLLARHFTVFPGPYEKNPDMLLCLLNTGIYLSGCDVMIPMRKIYLYDTEPVAFFRYKTLLNFWNNTKYGCMLL